jgi:hypothetical protein
VAIDVGLGRRRRHQRHHVERRHQDAAVEHVKVHQRVELRIEVGARLRASAGALGGEHVLRAAPEPRHLPRQPVLGYRVGDSALVALRERDHSLESLVRQHLGQGRADGGKRERVARQRPADPAHVGVVPVGVLEHLRGDLVAHPVGAGRDPARDRLADRQHVRLEALGHGVAARAAAQRVGLVDDQQRPCLARRAPQRVVVAGVGQHDPHVGHRRLGEHARDVAVAELAL